MKYKEGIRGKIYSASLSIQIKKLTQKFLGWSNKEMKYNEGIRDNASTADNSAKGDESFTKVQGLPHRNTNLRIDLRAYEQIICF